MNTTVPYHTPTHRNRWGQYESITYYTDHPDFLYIKIRIALVWFNRMGWYYSIQIEGHKLVNGEREFFIEMDSSEEIWGKGPEVTECAKAAENRCNQMLVNVGANPDRIKLNPYVLATKY